VGAYAPGGACTLAAAGTGPRGSRHPDLLPGHRRWEARGLFQPWPGGRAVRFSTRSARNVIILEALPGTMSNILRYDME